MIELALPLIVMVGIAISIPIVMKMLRKSELTVVEDRINQLCKLDAESAKGTVLSLVKEKRIHSISSDNNNSRQERAIGLGVLTRQFTEQFSKISGDDFAFWIPEKSKMLDGEFYIVGVSDDEHSRYILKANSDAKIDSTVSFPSIWHAILFEIESK